MGLFTNIKRHYVANDYEYQKITEMFTEILNGPLANIEVKPDSHEYMYDGHSTSTYEDGILKLYRFSSTGIGKGRISATREIILKNYGCVYDGERAIDCHLWYNHLLEIYNKSKEKRQRIDNLYHKVKKIFDCVPSGYSDEIIQVEYTKKREEFYSESEAEYQYINLYSGSIYLIPMNEYVYITDEICHKANEVYRDGEWINYVCDIIDNYENENHYKAQKVKRMVDRRPIDDSDIFK